MSNYLSEAFKKLDILDEDVFEVDKDGLTALKDFEDSNDSEDVITVVDPDAEDEEELEDSYIGKVILDCSVCHTDIYKDKEDITIDEESGLANIGEECPYCYSSEGFKIIGEVKPFVETDFETEDDVDVEVDEEEAEEDEDDLNESILRKGRKLVEDSWSTYYDSKDLCFEEYVNKYLINDVENSLKLNLRRNGDEFGIVKVYWGPSTRTYIATIKFIVTPSLVKKYGYNVKEDVNNFLYRSGEFLTLDDKELDSEEALKIVLNKLNEKFNAKKVGSDKILVLNKKTNESLKGHNKLVESISLGDLVSGDSATLMSPFYLGKTGEIADAGSTVEVSDLSGANDVPGGYHYRFYDKNGDLFYEDDLWLYNYDLDDYQDDGIVNPDLIKVKLNESLLRRNRKLKESCSINQCQKWVDYDMKKYKKISDDTMEKIKSSGYSVVKDQYGDYEVIADRKDESCGKRKSRKMKESIEDITIDTGEQEITVSAKDKEEIESDDEMIAPLSDEVKSDIEMCSDDTVDVDVDEFSEEDFDELGESYLKKVYENVNEYKTTSAKTKGNKLYIEGLIKFNSGKQKKTSFVFESKTITKTGKAKLIGENLQISRGHKSFKLTGTINNGKFISESLNYNYRVKNGSGEPQRVYGTAKKSK